MNTAATTHKAYTSAMRKNPTLWLGMAMCLLLAVFTMVSLFWTPVDPTKMRMAMRLQPPSLHAPAGTDAMGRDVFSKLMLGAWNSYSIAVLAVAIGLFFGTILGCLAAGGRGFVETVIMRLNDVIFAFPALISAIVIAALIGPGRWTAVIAIAVFTTPIFARVVRAEALRIWPMEFCMAAKTAGKSVFDITLRHVLPNIAGVLIVQFTIQISMAILIEAGLSFLGLSLAPPAPSWGRQLADSQTLIGIAPWMAIGPGIAIAFSVVSLNLLGDGLRLKLDPAKER